MLQRVQSSALYNILKSFWFIAFFLCFSVKIEYFHQPLFSWKHSNNLKWNSGHFLKSTILSQKREKLKKVNTMCLFLLKTGRPLQNTIMCSSFVIIFQKKIIKGVTVRYPVQHFGATKKYPLMIDKIKWIGLKFGQTAGTG